MTPRTYLGAAAALAAVAVTAAAIAAFIAAGFVSAQDAPPPPRPEEGLRPVADFDAIADETARSVAIFEETGRVLLHPRCVNCHPVGDAPLQGMDMRVHQPPAVRGDADFGAAGMTCNTCHGPANVAVIAQAEGIQSIPGNPAWHLAPVEMAWEGKSLAEICAQIKDPERNGGKTLAELVEHMAEDDLVGWGWDPGSGREPVPGTQEAFGALYRAWADTGAHCPAG